MPWHGFLIDSFFYFTNAVFLFEISQKGFIPRNLKKIQNEVDNIVVSIVIGKKNLIIKLKLSHFPIDRLFSKSFHSFNIPHE